MRGRKTRRVLFALIFLAAATYVFREASGIRFPLPYLDLVTGERKWAIGLYEGSSPFSFQPPGKLSQPILRARDVTDFAAVLVADPFLVREKDRWLILFEAADASGRGRIAWAEADSAGENWEYRGVALEEDFHLSYPGVVREDGEWFLVPEMAAAGRQDLYRALEFPHRWEAAGTILPVPLKDPSLLSYAGNWYLFGCDLHWNLRLYLSARLAGPWREHPASPIVRGDRSRARPGGRMVVWEGRPVRYAQDCEEEYGSAVRAFVVEVLTPDDYREKAADLPPVISASGRGWNRRGMHHLSPVEVSPSRWLAAVDGYPGRDKSLVFGWGDRLRRGRVEESAWESPSGGVD